MGADREGDLIAAIYDAALGQRSWTEVGQNLMAHAGSQAMTMSMIHPRTGKVDVLTWLGHSQEALQRYGDFASHDVWVAGYLENRLFGRAMIGSAVVDDRTLTNSIIYNEYLVPYRIGLYHMLGSVSPMDGGHQAIVGMHRPRDNRDFTSVDAKRLERLLPHITRAMEVRLRLQQAEQLNRSVYSVLDRLSVGVVLMGATGRLLHVNAAADAIFHTADGLMRTPDGFRAAMREDDRRLQELIGALRHTSGDRRSAGGHLRVQRPSGQTAYALMLAPMGTQTRGTDPKAPAILVFISDPGAKIVSDLAVLTELFGFPPAEGRLVLALLSGISPPEFARNTGITYNTAKTLLARAMTRTDSRSQLEMVLLVASALGGAVLAPPGREG